MTLVIESYRHIARDAIVLGIHVFGQLPAVASVLRVGGVNVVLKHADNLLRIRRIYRDGWLGERPHRRRERKDLSLRSYGKLLPPREQRRSAEQCEKS